jgi:dihydroflavonol-4-reductase
MGGPIKHSGLPFKLSKSFRKESGNEVFLRNIRMNIFIVGGTGFIGYHTALEGIRRGYNITVFGLPPGPADQLFPPEVKIILADLNASADDEVYSILTGFDSVVFAAGADDRILPPAPAYDFFYRANVQAARRFFRLARKAGVKRGVLIGSYFAHFARIWPELKLTERHPYIRSRVEQAQQALEVSLPDLELMVLELPYVFGAMPGQTPLWKPLINYICSPWPLFFPRGGTNCISVQNVARAIVGALENGISGEIYPIGDKNLTWVELLSRLTKFTGKDKRVITCPDWILRLGLFFVYHYHHLRGKESGLNLRYFADLQTAETCFDPTNSQTALGYETGDLDLALHATVNACKD